MRYLVLVTLAACGFGDDRTTAGLDDGGDLDGDARVVDARPGLDGGPGPDAAVVACTLVPQGGCPAGRACDLLGASGDTTCREVTTAGTADDRCASATQCAIGWSCLETQGDGSCLALCASDGHCAPTAGSRCLIQLRDSGGQPIPGARYCTQACTPQTAAGCPAGWNCVVSDDGGGDVTSCQPSGVGGQGDACGEIADCAAGYTCVVRGSTLSCQRHCRVGVSGSCASFAGTACAGFSSPHVIAGVEWGVCL